VAEAVEAAKVAGTGLWIHKGEPERACYLPSFMVENIVLIAIGKPVSQIAQPQGAIPPHLLQ
jgi:hypothetical protein